MTETTAPLTEATIVAFLDDCFEVEFTFRDTAEPAAALVDLPRSEQEFVLDWVKRAASTNIEVAYQFAQLAGRALRAMDSKLVEAWVLHAMDVYDRAGLRPALAAIHEVDDFLQRNRERTAGALLEEYSGILAHFVNGLSGRRLRIDEGDAAYTDTDVLYFPPVTAEFASETENFQLLKATAALLWAQTRFGSFRADLDSWLAGQDDPADALRRFQLLETLRLEACLARELPGLFRTMRLLDEQRNGQRSQSVQSLAERLSGPLITVDDVMKMAADLAELSAVSLPCYSGIVRLEAISAARTERVEREKARFRVALRELLEEQRRKQPDAVGKFSTRSPPAEVDSHSLEMEILLDDKPIAPPEVVRQLSNSIILDFGALPDDYLVAAGPGEYDPKLLFDEKPDVENVWGGTYHEEGALFYNEWDYQRRHYRKNWCVMRETEITPVYDTFIADTRHKYGPLIKQLRKTFEAMRDEDRLLKRQSDGDEVDIDALIEALADARDGSEMSQRLFTRMHRAERNIAVAFMVDMSGSTKGWINDAEREALLLLCEALETLGDRYAIYGFSGTTRKRCDLFRIKRFDERFDSVVQGRISAIRPKDYTRMGFAIRHLSSLLNEVDAKTRILITISDGKPDDLTDYRGEYGIEDTRRALIEARRAGIHPYCITIDEQARDYLPHMYGPAAYTVVDDVRALPFKVSDIYRRLTL